MRNRFEIGAQYSQRRGGGDGTLAAPFILDGEPKARNDHD